MKKYIFKGFLAGFLMLAIINFLFFEKEIIPCGTELLEIKGYAELSSEEKERIESLKGNFHILEMEIYQSGFDTVWYKEHNDILIGKEIIFQDVNRISFCDEDYQAVSIIAADADYYWEDRYRCRHYFGKKSVVTIWFFSLESGNSFAIHLPANGGIFFQPGEMSCYGDDPYVLYETWGMYAVI